MKKHALETINRLAGDVDALNLHPIMVGRPDLKALEIQAFEALSKMHEAIGGGPLERDSESD